MINIIKRKRQQVLSILVVISFFITFKNANALTYYTRNSGNWSTVSTWSLIGYGGIPTVLAPGINDTAKIGDTYTVTINGTISCAQVVVGQGASGILQYSGAGTYSLTVTGNVTVYPGGSFIYNTNGSKTHTLSVGGNFTNNGNVDLYVDANDIVNTTFNTSSTSIISGSGTWSLNNVTINKSSSAGIVDVQVSAFESAIVTLAGTTGTYIHDNSGSYSVNSASASDFAINQNMIYKVPMGTMWFSPNSSRTYLYGALYVSGGNVFIGTSAGTNGIRYDQVGTGVPYLEISSGTLTVYGGINYSSGAGNDPFSFRMTGGDLLLNSGSSNISSEAFLVNDDTASVFYMSGGTITIQNHVSSPGENSADWDICGTLGSVTSLGGLVQFGNSSTVTGTIFDFVPYPNVVQPNFKVSGPTSASVSLRTSKSAIDDFKLLSLYIDTNKIFDVQSIQGVPGNTKIMTLTSSYNGVYGFYNSGTFTAENGTIIMAGTSAQSIGGSSTATFYNLIIDNASGVTLEKTEYVSNLLTMTSGLLHTTAAKIITVTSTGNATMGSSSSYVDGPMIQTVADNSLTTRNFPLGKGGAYRPAILTATHSNTTSVTYTGEMINSSPRALAYALPSTVNSISNTRYWDFTRENISNLTTAALTIYYDLDDTVPNKNRVVVVHDNGSARWVDYGGTATADSTGNIKSISITSFKTKFTFGFPPSQLPVELVSFTAKKSEKVVKCDWETASEINNDFFTVERSEDGSNFTPIATIKGAGNSTSNKSYHYEDKAPLPGDSYYRLKQTDFDGKFEYADVVHVFIAENSGEYTFFPNPSPGKVHIIKPGETMEGISAYVQDMNGKQVQADLQLSTSKNELTVDISPTASATNDFFVLYIFTPTGTIKEKVIVGNK